MIERMTVVDEVQGTIALFPEHNISPMARFSDHSSNLHIGQIIRTTPNQMLNVARSSLHKLLYPWVD
jgi:hypothetical protein